MVEISASILNVNKEKVIKTIYNLETAKIDYFHIDVMDGDFVENNTTEKMQEYCDYLNNITNVPLDVHLMVKDVQKYIDIFLPYNPNIITVHYEAFEKISDLEKIINYIHNNNCKVGISIKPETDVSNLYDILNKVNIVLIMTVEPGKGGQQLLEPTIDKIRELSKYIKNNGLETIIEADGGINIYNAKMLKEAGTEILVVGTALIHSENYSEEVKKIKD